MTKRLESIEDEIDNVNTIDISNTSDWFYFQKLDGPQDDPFKIGLDEIKKLRGLGTNFKRKVNRDFSKAFVGTDGAKTQQNLLQQAITGYAFFDLVEPTYNLEYLSKIYEISTYNYAAINAKVSNIVGLGYMFTETNKAKDAMDSINDSKQLDRARTKIDRIKTQLE
jgi:hypothetical protein